NLAFNEITDLKPLAGLTKLKWLSLGNNQITDLKPLAGLTKLESLRNCPEIDSRFQVISGTAM
ncbi:MAG: leucine-rich repeat domain-containing protein, partial [Planctomycetes bacterium]|nr:leucine-rich repeat domain-containing protein [Planctomycetota bacterium]